MDVCGSTGCGHNRRRRRPATPPSAQTGHRPSPADQGTPPATSKPDPPSAARPRTHRPQPGPAHRQPRNRHTAQARSQTHRPPTETPPDPPPPRETGHTVRLGNHRARKEGATDRTAHRHDRCTRENTRGQTHRHASRWPFPPVGHADTPSAPRNGLFPFPSTFEIIS